MWLVSWGAGWCKKIRDGGGSFGSRPVAAPSRLEAEGRPGAGVGAGPGPGVGPGVGERERAIRRQSSGPRPIGGEKGEFGIRAKKPARGYRMEAGAYGLEG